MRRSGVSRLCHRPDEAVASNRAARRSPVDRLVFLTATCPSLHLLRTDAGPGRGARLSTNLIIVSRTYGDMRHFYIRMPSRSHRRRRCEAWDWRGVPVGSGACSRRGGSGSWIRHRPRRRARATRPDVGALVRVGLAGGAGVGCTPVRAAPGTPRAGPGADRPGLRNASPVRQDPPHLAPCELSVTESACARFAPAHLA